jgi:hypothetical protein
MPQDPAYKRALVLEQLSAVSSLGGIGSRGSLMIPFDDQPHSMLSPGSSIDTEREAVIATIDVSEPANAIRTRWASGGLFKNIIGNNQPPKLGPGQLMALSRSRSASPSRRGSEARERPLTSTPDLKKLVKRDPAFVSTPSLPSSSVTSSASTSATTSAKSSRPTTSGRASTSGQINSESSLPSVTSYCFRFSLDVIDRRHGPPAAIALRSPLLPGQAQILLANKLRRQSIVRAREHQRNMSSDSAKSASSGKPEPYAQFNPNPPTSAPADDMSSFDVPSMVSAETTAAYCGRSLAEWTIVVGECQMFFERRRHEGCPTRWVETPLLGTEHLVRGPRG